MYCQYYQTKQCQSCQWIERPYSEQLEAKQQHLASLLAHKTFTEYLPPVTSPLTACRNRAKMAVAGSVEKPILGIYTSEERKIDLCHCPLYSEILQQAFSILKQFILRAGLTPYHIGRKRGELKFILLTQNQQEQLLLRFVLRSNKKIAQIQAQLAWLMAKLPNLVVVSVNLQPIAMAVLEGKEEIILTEELALSERLNHVPLFIRPQSFFQTNTRVAERLYAAAQCWVAELPIKSLWDLFCGIGGFGLHCAKKDHHLVGIEINAPAIASAKESAKWLALEHIDFQSIDLTKTDYQMNDIPDLVIVNPPRRGIGKRAIQFLRQLSPTFILYSSCNPVTMVADLTHFSHYAIRKIQLFDMFPHTAHYEVLILLEKVE